MRVMEEAMVSYIKDLGLRIVHGFTQWDRGIHIIFIFLAGFLSLHFNDPRFFIAGFFGAVAYSIGWFKVATKR